MGFSAKKLVSEMTCCVSRVSLNPWDLWYMSVTLHESRCVLVLLQMLVRCVERSERCAGLQMVRHWPCSGSTADFPSGVCSVPCFIIQWPWKQGLLSDIIVYSTVDLCSD